MLQILIHRQYDLVIHQILIDSRHFPSDVCSSNTTFPQSQLIHDSNAVLAGLWEPLLGHKMLTVAEYLCCRSAAESSRENEKCIVMMQSIYADSNPHPSLSGILWLLRK